MTQQVKQVEGAVGYVELIYAISNNLPYAQIKNSAGSFVEPSLETVTNAAASAKLGKDTDFRVSVPYQCAGQGCLPDRVVHLAAGSEGQQGRREGQGDPGLPDLDDQR